MATRSEAVSQHLSDTAPQESISAVPGKGNLSADPSLGTQYSVDLDFFSGPMDLLLHLVSQQEFSIAEVRMSVIAEQYLEIVSCSAAQLDLEQATEYLVIAATLMAIKSRSLLPVEQLLDDEDGTEADQESSFFEDLRARLIAYQQTQTRAASLMRVPQLGVDTFSRIDRKALLPTPEMLAEPEDAHLVASVFASLLKRIGSTADSLRIALEPISVVSYMMRILDSFGGGPIESGAGAVRDPEISKVPKTLIALIGSFLPGGKRGNSSELPRQQQIRGAIIGSFIATLELVRRGLVRVSQTGDQSEINIELASYAELRDGDLVLTSEFDEDDSERGSAPALQDRQSDNVVHISEYREGERSTQLGAEGELEIGENEEGMQPQKREVGST